MAEAVPPVKTPEQPPEVKPAVEAKPQPKGFALIIKKVRAGASKLLTLIKPKPSVPQAGAEAVVPGKIQVNPPVKVELQPMSGRGALWVRTKRAALKYGAIGALSTVTAAGAGHLAQNQFRDWADYHPDASAPGPKKGLSNLPLKKSTAKPPESITDLLTDPTKLFDWLKKMKQEIETDIVDYIRLTEIYKEISGLHNKLLGVLDETVSWGARIFSFILMAQVLLKLWKVKNANRLVDPVVEANMKAIVAGLNTLGQQFYELTRNLAVQPGPAALKGMMDQVQALAPRVDVLAKQVFPEGEPAQVNVPSAVAPGNLPGGEKT